MLISTGLNWFLTIGLSNSDLNSGFNLDFGFRYKGGSIAGLFIKKDYFISSFKSK